MPPADIADVPTPFTTKLTPEQMVEYRKRKVALISGACSFEKPWRGGEMN